MDTDNRIILYLPSFTFLSPPKKWFEPCYLRFLRVGNPPKYIFSCPFKLSPEWLPVEVVAIFSSSLVSMSTIDMLAGKDLRLVSKIRHKQ